MKKAIFFVPILLILLIVAFLQQEEYISKSEPRISRILPAPVQKVLLGNLKELGALSYFLRASVYIGAEDFFLEKNADILAQNFQVITTLHPKLIDSYYYCQATISHISPFYAQKSVDILLEGAKENPNDIYLPFFAAFNYFYYIHNYNKASELLFELSQRQDQRVPEWIGHLAAVFAARGGDLQNGLLTLQIMEKIVDESHRQRYRDDIVVFEKALVVSRAIDDFEKKYRARPANLQQLIPEFLTQIPDVGTSFVLTYKGYKLSLERAVSFN